MLWRLQPRQRLSIKEFLAGKKAAFGYGILAAFLVLAFTKPQIVFGHYEQGMKRGFEVGYIQGKRDALNPTAANHELESTCVGMWVTGQIHQEKANAKR